MNDEATMGELQPFEAAYRAYLSAVKQAWADVDIDALTSSLESLPGLQGCQACGQGFSTTGTAGTIGTAGTFGGTAACAGTVGTFGCSSQCHACFVTMQSAMPGAATTATIGTQQLACWPPLSPWPPPFPVSTVGSLGTAAPPGAEGPQQQGPQQGPAQPYRG